MNHTRISTIIRQAFPNLNPIEPRNHFEYKHRYLLTLIPIPLPIHTPTINLACTLAEATTPQAVVTNLLLLVVTTPPLAVAINLRAVAINLIPKKLTAHPKHLNPALSR